MVGTETGKQRESCGTRNENQRRRHTETEGHKTRHRGRYQLGEDANATAETRQETSQTEKETAQKGREIAQKAPGDSTERQDTAQTGQETAELQLTLSGASTSEALIVSLCL